MDTSSITSKAITAVFWALVFLSFLTPIELGDVWWHLKTGQWIVENLGLPSGDPFSIYTGGNPFVLRAFWASQTLLYLIERASGLYGVVALKALFFTAVFFIVHRTLRMYNLSATLSYIILIPAILVSISYDEARPQSFSFLFFALALYLLEGGGSIWLLPPIMLLWANIYPGFILGDALIAIYAVRKAFLEGAKEKFFFLSCIAAVALSFLNPNWAEPFRVASGMFVGSAKGNAPIHEHMSLKGFAQFTGAIALYYMVFGLMALALAGFLLRAWKTRKTDVVHLVIFLGFSYASLTTFRAGFFFAVVATLTLGRNLSSIIGKKEPLWSKTKILLAASALVLASFIVIPRSLIIRPLITEDIIPVKAAGFLETEAPPGNIFHPYEWGGYLIWRLYPEYRVFIDGRGLGLMDEYNDIVYARQGWKETLEKFNVNTVVFWAILPYEGSVPPVVFALLKDSEWSAVYWDLQSVMFVRSPYAKRAIMKDAVRELLISLIAQNISRHPSEPKHYVALGEVYIERGMKQNAKEAFGKALALDPKNKKAALWISALR